MRMFRDARVGKPGVQTSLGRSGVGRIGLRVALIVIVLLGLVRVAHAMPLALFVATFDDDPGLPADAFSQTLAGVQFDFTFTSQGDGGNGMGFAFDSAYGEENSSSINLQSGSPNLSTEERVTITRQDGQDFVFTSLFINNTAVGETVVVGGYNNNVLVGTQQTMVNGESGTLTFGGLIVDEVRITSVDFINTNIDSFTGDTAVPTAVTLSKLHAASATPAVLPGMLLLLAVTLTAAVVGAKRLRQAGH